MSNIINGIISFMGKTGWISGFLLVFFESIIPVVPLSVFVALNVVTYKYGLIISWVGTVLGCFTSFLLCRKFSHYLNKKFKDNKKVKDFRKNIDKISFSNLIILFSIPFTPAFVINIAAGLGSISKRRYLIALLIGKLPMIYFWGYIGKNLSESITDISVLARIVFMVVMAFLVGKVTNKFIKE